ncbi:MAG TPA: tetratricopeptide repeat protein [Chthoniobacterales bacterium]|nr:tetratricopeptide repeat protein [Chthoniobacterales bacterium]
MCHISWFAVLLRAMSRYRVWIFALLLITAATIAYLPALNGTPLWDDDAHLTRPELRSLEGLTRIWTQPSVTQQYYPLVHTAFWTEHQLWGDAHRWYHVTNILIHCLSALLLLQILRKLEIPGAWLAALIFAIHPIQVETVAWISELKNVLSGAFYFASILVYLRFDETRRAAPYWMSLALFLAGLLSKSVIATLPAILLVIFWWKRGTLSFKRDLLPLIPFFLLGIGFGLFTAWVERNLIGAQGADYNYTIVERGLIAGRVIWFYLSKLFWPAELIFIYPRWQISQAVWWQYLFPAGVILLLGAAVWLSRKWRGPLAGLLIFSISLLPVLGFLNVYPFRYSLVADHFAYLAGLGIIVPISAGITLFCEHYLQAPVRYIPPALLLVGLVLLSANQSRMYTDIDTLWRTTLERNPCAWMAHNNLGVLLLRRGKVEEAISHFRKAIGLNAHDAATQSNLGDAYLALDRVDDAIAQYRTALQIKPNDAASHYNFANALLKQGLIDDALAEYQAALDIRPNDVDVLNNLGVALLEQGRVDEAIIHYQKALELRPKDVRAQANLAWALSISTTDPRMRGAIAIRLAQQASENSGGENPAILRILAAAYAQAGRFTEAVACAQRALDLALNQHNIALVTALKDEIQLYGTNAPYRVAVP